MFKSGLRKRLTGIGGAANKKLQLPFPYSLVLIYAENTRYMFNLNEYVVY